ncbi:hypothetical protein KY363_01085 [Candidatus Woesearchaeota archaeon]|nr:hypothetical protein [Candidatus Woesearchaeota archaeon]
MELEYRNYKDFSQLIERPLEKNGRKVTLILPARNEHETIGSYFPCFAGLMRTGCIDEIILADSSDDPRTIDNALDAAIETEPFATLLLQAAKEQRPLPLKTVSVFDPELAGIFNGHKPKRGIAPGKGTTMYLGLAVATGDLVLFLDSDFKNIDPRFVYGLAGPFEDSRTVLSKATFELEDTYDAVIEKCRQEHRPVETCDLLLKSVNSRTLAKPLMQVLDQTAIFPAISQFNGPLSGGCGASKALWHSIMVPSHYGIEVSYLMQFTRRLPNGHIAYDVNLGEVEQESQDSHGRSSMAKNIIGTIIHHLHHYSPDLYNRLRSEPELLSSLYQQAAAQFTVHNTDPLRVRLYSDMMHNVLSSGDLSTVVFPPLQRNVYYTERQDVLRAKADQLTVQRLRETTMSRAYSRTGSYKRYR